MTSASSTSGRQGFLVPNFEAGLVVDARIDTTRDLWPKTSTRDRATVGDVKRRTSRTSSACLRISTRFRRCRRLPLPHLSRRSHGHLRLQRTNADESRWGVCGRHRQWHAESQRRHISLRVPDARNDARVVAQAIPRGAHRRSSRRGSRARDQRRGFHRQGPRIGSPVRMARRARSASLKAMTLGNDTVVRAPRPRSVWHRCKPATAQTRWARCLGVMSS